MLLFQNYPGLRDKLPYQELATLPTPLTRLQSLASNAWIKEDNVANPEYGGNKIRKLEWVIAEALSQNCRRIVTLGAIGTNAGVATTLVCKQHGLACRIIMFDQPMSETVIKNFSLMHDLGAEFDYQDTLWRAARRFYLHPGRLQDSDYFLDAGCSNTVSSLGYVNAAFELKQQCAERGLPDPAAIFIPVGSGSTVSGLAVGLHLAGLDTRIHAIQVAPYRVGVFSACHPRTIRKQIQNCLARYFPVLRATAIDNWCFDRHWIGGGYGVSTPECLQAMQAAREYGVILEQTYSAKAYAAFLDYLGRAAAQRPVIFWNTFNSRPLPRETALLTQSGIRAILAGK